MSGFGDLTTLECVVETCPLYDHDVFGAHITIALDFYPIFLTVGIYAVSLYKYELYFALVSVVLTLNWGVNYGIQRMVGPSSRFPECGSAYQMPSFSSQHIVLFETMMALFMLTWGQKLYIKLIILLRLFSFAVLVSRIYIGVNTTTQLLAGAGVGFVSAIVYHIIIYFLIYPYFTRILDFTLMRWLGLEDNLCRKNSSKIRVKRNTNLTKALETVARSSGMRVNTKNIKYVTISVKQKKALNIKID